MSVGDLALARVARAGLDAEELARVVKAAIDEDLRFGPDLTTRATVPEGSVGVGDVAARSPGLVAGLPVALFVLGALGVEPIELNEPVEDGTRVGPGQVVLSVTAPLAGLLTAERTVLNFLTHLSGVATATAAWVDELAGTGCRVRDTRKTLPGLRQLEKYAVRVGGGVNHRLGLGDAALVKDNHVEAAGSMTAAVTRVRAAVGDIAIEVECDTIDQVGEALEAGATILLLDNMDEDTMSRAVELARQRPGILLEASGGVSLDRARRVAETGVDFISVGALTHSAPALDLGLDLRPRT